MATSCPALRQARIGALAMMRSRARIRQAQGSLHRQDEEGLMQASPCLPLKKSSTVIQYHNERK
jgi:hypothetical protein